ncbi:hypothetical protein RN001_003334 [Aquatica leii]|uniref:DDE Tnp4 domain-containing protein n=1 Tax=Aquatica leii TaxID=1421715 RepID=A0AAN7PIF4_9COLE|nr:hypothetical protein RN001_003334 [Aquatica leii]
MPRPSRKSEYLSMDPITHSLYGVPTPSVPASNGFMEPIPIQQSFPPNPMFNQKPKTQPPLPSTTGFMQPHPETYNQNFNANFQQQQPPVQVAQEVPAPVEKFPLLEEHKIIQIVFDDLRNRKILSSISQLKDEYIKWPTPAECVQIAARIENRCQLPGVVGAIDGTHIVFKQAKNNAIDFYNRKGQHSMPGRLHDARVFSNSPLFNKLVNDPIFYHHISIY